MFEKLLVAIDHSEHTERTLAAARELAEKAGSELRVLHVEEVGFAGRAGEVPLEDRDEVKRLVDEAVAELTSAGLKATGVVRAAQHHRVAAEIAEDAEEWGASAIVAGSFGHHAGVDGILIGSTVNRLLHVAHLPVIVVR